MKSRPSRFMPVFGVPLVIGLLGAAGLFAALLGDGWWDSLAWLGLGAPAVISLWALRPWAKALPSRRQHKPPH